MKRINCCCALTVSTVLKILSCPFAEGECLAFRWVWDASMFVSKWSSLLLLLDFKMYVASLPETSLVKNMSDLSSVYNLGCSPCLISWDTSATLDKTAWHFSEQIQTVVCRAVCIFWLFFVPTMENIFVLIVSFIFYFFCL